MSSQNSNILFYAPTSPFTPTPIHDRFSEFDPYSTPSYEDQSTPAFGANAPLLPNRDDGQFLRAQQRRPQNLSVYTHTSQGPAYDPDTGYFDPNVLHSGHLSTASTLNDEFLRTPDPSRFPKDLSRPIRLHPFARNFEAPEWSPIILHVFGCIAAYPLLFLSTIVARDRSLFWTRFLVGAFCGTAGFVLGLSLLRLGKNFLESATWATLIHQSRVSSAPGIPLKDLAASSQDPTSAWSAVRLLWSRLTYPGAARSTRRSYDRRPWSMYIMFFLLIVAVASALPFLLGRFIGMNTAIFHQHERYHETYVAGALSAADISRADSLAKAFNDFSITWTLSPFASHSSLPPPVSFPWEGDIIYFAEQIRSQLVPGGYGTFTANSTQDLPSSLVTSKESPGSLLRYPRWGIRIHCEKIPAQYIVPRAPSGLTYIFTPRSIYETLFTSFAMEFPESLRNPLNLTAAMQAMDQFPLTLNSADISRSAYFSDNGVAHSFKSEPMTMGAEGYGWTTVETVLIRLNTTYAPNGVFVTKSDASVLDGSGRETWIGYDAATCLQLYEPYVVETYNSSLGLPSSTRIVSKGKAIIDLDDKETETRGPLKASDAERELNSTGLASVYETLHGNSINQMLKDNGRDAYYVPSPTLISFTNGQGPNGYTELEAGIFAQARGLADASNALPYFTGSGRLVARVYPDQTLTNAYIDNPKMISLLTFVLLLGLVAGLFVPRLPLQVPKRGFELYSWLAAFHGDEVVSDYKVRKNMSLEEIEASMGDLKFRYGF